MVIISPVVPEVNPPIETMSRSVPPVERDVRTVRRAYATTSERSTDFEAVTLALGNGDATVGRP
ncbi:hypothetical protein [Actinomadura atramentaria]|uniref:hypothetical protein n=1 Tax=Actinomadura atramentaria TaxID=1990 RepID=UPI0012FB9FD8|nr:hypothetical protein [Actinomadura atramentaria]